VWSVRGRMCSAGAVTTLDRRGVAVTSPKAESRQDTSAERRGQAGTVTAERPPETAPQESGVALQTSIGTTRIVDAVVAKIAGLAARDIPGVFAMGSGMSRRVGQLRSMIPGSGQAADQGVSVEVGQREAAVDLNIVTWYGQSIVEISEAVRRNVIGQVEGMCGLKVIEVNIQVDDIHVESIEDNQPEQQQRVQ
jgi:uncharacterized alkaline shock family protein YloU